MIYGIDSREAANTRLTNGYDLYGWVARRGFPAYWGRALNGKDKLTPEEITFLHDKGCRIALIFDDLSEAGVSAMDGSKDGQRAAAAAKSLGAPAGRGIAVFAAIKDNWSVNNSWMVWFTRTLWNNGYMAGYMGNTDSSKNFNFGRECSHYASFMGEAGKNGTAYWATEPRPGVEPSAWEPYCPSQLTPEEIDLWSNGEKIKYRDMVFNKSYARGEAVLRLMW